MRTRLVLGSLIAVGLMLFTSGPPSSTANPSCAGLKPLPILGADLCTHGGDPVPAKTGATCIYGVLCVSSPLTNGTPPPKAPCLGDGVSSKRIQLFYGQVAGEPDDSARAIPAIRTTADYVNQAYQSLGYNVRWVCSSAGQTVGHVFLPSHDFTTMIATMRALGYTASDRIYAVMEKTGPGNGYVGFGTVHSDDHATDNTNDSGPSYSVIYSFTDSSTLMHETGHNMGAVQLSAPHSSGAWHCYDEQDIMCYNDGGPYFQNGGQIWYRCPSGSLAQEWDCGREDYWNPAPASGTYLASHWDLARSSFLQPTS